MTITKEILSETIVCIIISNTDSITFTNATEFQEKTLSLMNGHEHNILDLAAINFIDSSGLGALMVIFKQLHKKRNTLHLLHVSRKIQLLFEITKTDNVLSTYTTIESIYTDIHAYRDK